MIEPGTCLRFKTGEHRRLQAELAPMTLVEITKAIVDRDARTIFAALKHGLKVAGGNEPFRITPAQLEDLPFHLGAPCDVLDDAFLWSWTGKSRLELREQLAALASEPAQAEDDDTATLDGEGEEAGDAKSPFADSEESSML